MHRSFIARRQLAGLLRRRPILDSTVTGSNDVRPADDELRTILETVDGGVDPGDGQPGGRLPHDYPRGNNRI